jgi:NADH-quinone oxidoreductase subunit L
MLAAESAKELLDAGPWILRNAWLLYTIPFVSFWIILFFGKRMGSKAAWVGIASVLTTFVLACWSGLSWISVYHHRESAPVIRELWTLYKSAGVTIDFGTHVDGLTVMMLFVVTLISSLVHIYSTEYMKDDRRFTYYYAALSMFTASMLLLVTASSTLVLLIGWELVGLCSFMLIGHWWEEQANSNAALKAFFTTRTGDIGLLVGVIITPFIVLAATGRFSFGIDALNASALSGRPSHLLLLVCASCLMVAIIGKSGQFPLHTWLPDAMAGPTPVSALIHAATMVVAGVYLGARVYGVFWEGFSINAGGVNFMALIGGITIIIGAALAFVQKDIKKVLAYSTISQLGFMVMALGVGAWLGAIFHLFTHAFFKANLFLGAGSISHSGSHHSFDMKKDMGGLRKYMPVTFATFIIGTLALTGFPLLAGFWSKDEIITAAGQGGFSYFMIVGLVGAVMTAVYMGRCVYLTFFGEYRGHGHPHESNRTITIPLIILSVFSVFVGLINAAPLGIEKFKEWIEPESEAFLAFPVREITHVHFSYTNAAIAIGVAFLGYFIAWAWYWKKWGPHGITERNKFAHAGYVFLENKYYLDDLYTGVIVGGIKGPIAKASNWINQNIIDAVPNGIGKGAVVFGNFSYDVIDRDVIDGTVNGLAAGADGSGGLLRKLQTGRVQWYALSLFFAVGLISLAVALYG